MGAQKRLIRTICLAAVIASSAANSAFAHETETQEGVASFYSDRFQGATTASGEPFDQQALTAAHPSLPFGTKVLVTRPDTGQEVEVLINDRRPPEFAVWNQGVGDSPGHGARGRSTDQ